MSRTQLRQNAEPQQELTTLSVGVSSQISHTVEPLATAGPFGCPPEAFPALWAFLEWTILSKENENEHTRLLHLVECKGYQSYLQIGMVHSLPHFCQEVKDVSVVIQNRSLGNVIIKGTLGLSVQGIVEIFLSRMESNCLDRNNTWR
jgi:hypothetical protein